ncbi:hypothetical protein BTN49_2327 [Candidatus Enterovibrio escicola]|uniref:Uncharacterized protein n=1 Tax=Candidatus Enterovibrio escicola TaxID=1927127 RepID=A0A2A5T1M4_9GAMM|nr:hypothetical protein BTN49_2327 [Candidatus Enterovibrio escacola]
MPLNGVIFQIAELISIPGIRSSWNEAGGYRAMVKSGV